MFHVEKKKIFFSKKALKDNQSIYSGSEVDIIYSKELGLAKTVFKKDRHLKENISSSEYLPHSKRKLTLVSLLYSFARALMFAYKHKMIEKIISKKSKILDFGSGTGDFLLYMKRKNHQVYGVEPNKAAREISSKNGIIPFENLKQLQGAKFHTITLWHVLEHLQDPSQAIKSFHKMLDKEGVLIVAVPNLESHDALHYKNFWAALDIPRHLWHFTSKGVLKIVQENGFSFVKVFPLWFDTLYISYLSERNRSKKFALIRGVFKGIYFNLKSFKTKKYSSLTFVFRKTSP